MNGLEIGSAQHGSLGFCLLLGQYQYSDFSGHLSDMSLQMLQNSPQKKLLIQSVSLDLLGITATVLGSALIYIVVYD
jgi:hypothetical protein